MGWWRGRGRGILGEDLGPGGPNASEGGTEEFNPIKGPGGKGEGGLSQGESGREGRRSEHADFPLTGSTRNLFGDPMTLQDKTKDTPKRTTRHLTFGPKKHYQPSQTERVQGG